MILVVEDDPTLLAVICEDLEDQGYEPFGAPGPAAALKAAEARRFELMITDVRMDQMDGIECLKRLRAMQPLVKCIVITGYADADVPLRAVQAQADDYLHKPFTLREFRSVVQRVLGVDKERAYYAGLFDAVRTGLKRLTETESSDEVLKQARDRAFQSFFVAIRSGLLGQNPAQKIWERLEQLELKRARGEDLAELAENYLGIIEMLGTLGQAKTGAGPSDEIFSRFFRRLKGGTLSNEQVKMAALVRQLPPEAANSQLARLRDQMWGLGDTP